MKNYPLALSSWGKEEISAIHSVIESDMYSMGPYVKKFEHEFANFVGASYAVMVNSGSSANLLAIASLFYTSRNSLKVGDEVIVPAVSWSTTYFPLSQLGLKLKFVDVDPETLNYDLAELEQAVSSSTKLIVAVNLLGNPNDFKFITRLVRENDLILFEDNCESLGAEFQNQQSGTFGLMGSFSTFFSHHISTMEGGVVVTDNEELYHIMLSMRSHGWTRHLPEQNTITGRKSSDTFEESYKFVLPGYNLRPVEMSGAIGLEQLKKLPSFITGRRQNAAYFLEKMHNIDGLKVQREIGESSWFGFSIIVQEEYNLTRNDLVKKLTVNGIECRPIVAGNFTRNPVMKYVEHEEYGALPNADLVHDHGFFVGNHHIEMFDGIDYLVENLRN